MQTGLELIDGLHLTADGSAVVLVHGNERILVIADLHIGFELDLMGEGTYLPVLQYPNLERRILALVREYTIDRIVIDGDFKHEFARTTVSEWHEILDLWDALRAVRVGLELIRGNHDNYLINVLRQRGKSLIEPYLVLGSILISHGHKDFLIPDGVRTIVLAHEHPAVVLRDEIGGYHKFKCYLHGKHDGCDVLVLPAFSPLAPGTVVNGKDAYEFMSPVLRRMKMHTFIPIVVDRSEMLRFPPLELLEEGDESMEAGIRY